MVFRRKSGLQMPLSPYQVMSWTVFVYTILVFFIQIFPTYTTMQKIVIGLAIGISLCIIIVFLGLLTGSDPSDPLVQAYLESEDQSYKKNLVESTSRHCNYCEAPVSEVCTKHCLRCNRCTLRFDHHCKFVNNCIGILNYRYFVMLIISVEVHELIMTAVFVMFIADFQSDLNGFSFFTFLALFKSVLTIAFNSYLLGFHLYLMKKKITTYDFIMGRKKKLDSYVNPGQNLSDTNINI